MITTPRRPAVNSAFLGHLDKSYQTERLRESSSEIEVALKSINK